MARCTRRTEQGHARSHLPRRAHRRPPQGRPCQTERRCMTDERRLELRFIVAKGCTATVELRGKAITQEAIKKLIALLELSIDTFPAGAPQGAEPQSPGQAE